MVETNGVVTNLFIKRAHREPMEPVPEVHCVEGKGIVGDLAFGRPSRQVLIVDHETLDALSLQPGLVRENLTVRGIPLSSLNPAAILNIGEVELEITGDCAPCSRMDDIRPGLQQEIQSRRGVLARVVRSGVIRIGAPVGRPSSDQGQAQ